MSIIPSKSANNSISPVPHMDADTLTIASQLLDKLNDAILSDTSCLWGLKTEIQKLRRLILRFKKMLSQSSLAGEEHHQRLRQLKDVLNEGDELVHVIAAEKKKKLTRGCSSIGIRKVKHYCSSSNPLVFRSRMVFKIRAISRKLDGMLVSEFSEFHRPLSMSVDVPTVNTTSDVNPSEMIGLVEEKEKMIHHLISTDHQEAELRVIPIVGVGGVGKTTLAQLVFNDERVLNMYFELRAWVYVGKITSPRELETAIINSFTGIIITFIERYMKSSGSSNLVNDVRGKKYLLVLDDVCDHIDPQTLVDLKEFLMAMEGNGSRIIMTTRRTDVAENMGTVPPLRLEGLSFQDSWSLFCSRVSRQVLHEGIEQKIIMKCAGVPSAVTEMALTLSEITMEDLNTVSDYEIWEIPRFRCSSLLSILSYDGIPSGLRECFKYFSFFPKDHEFNSFELLQLWETFGLIDSKATGMDYLRRLWSLSLLKECNGEPAFCFKYKIPRLIHDMARWWATEDGEFAMVKPSTQLIDERIRHLFISPELSSHHTLSLLLDNIGNIQTLSFVDEVEESLVESFIQRCQLLRVLILRNSGLMVMPRGIKGLQRLQYLDLTGNERVKEIPNFICMLQNLETLLLEGCTAAKQLPRDIKNLSHLIVLSITTEQTFLPENGVGALTTLRVLAIIGCPNLKYLPQGIHLLTSLTSLIIRDCKSLTSLPRSMKYLVALETLVLSNCPKLRLNRKVEGEDHLNATGLSLHRCCLASLPLLSDLPQWLVRKSSQTLKSLHIEDCESLDLIPYWFTEELTSLEELEILNCKKLSLRQGIKPFNGLEKIKIEGCPNLTEQSLSNQGASPTQIPKSSNGGVQGGNIRMEKGKEVLVGNECDSFETTQGAISSADGAGPSSVIAPLYPNVKENFGGRKPAQGLATILSIGTANPANYILQDDFIDYYFRVTKSEHMIQVKEIFKSICDNAKVRKRHFVLTEEMISKNPNICTNDSKSLDIRHQIITSEVPKLALEAASNAIKEWGWPKSLITHLIFAAVSGVNMPRADYHLTKLLGLSASVKRTMICSQSFYASGTMLRMAKDIVENNAGSRVLIISSDISIDTFCGPNESDMPSLIANATVGDGAAALIIGADLDVSKEKPLFQIVSVSENIVPDSDGAINADVHEAGLSLYLTKDFPEMIANNFENSLKQALSQIDVADWNLLFWIIHPGGNAIVDQIETKLGLEKEKLWASRHVLSEFGNMSAATVFFALNEMRKKSEEAGKATTGDGLEWGILFGLGAATTIDIVVLRSFDTNAIS